MGSVKTTKGAELPLLNLKGKDYLQVAHRILWFREDHPLGRIDTAPIEITPEYAIYSAIISIPNDKGEYVKLSDAAKREDFDHFADAIEKSQTGAIGRALALCGYGTQFAQELDESDRIVDAPQVKKAPKPVETKQESDIHPLDDYVVKVGTIGGPIRGKAFGEIGPQKLKEAIAHAEKMFVQAKNGIPAEWQEFITKAKEWIK